MKLEAGKSEYPLPQDCFEIRLAVIFRDGADNTMLRSVGYRLLYQELVPGPDGIPTAYVVRNGQITFWPTPDKAYEVAIEYSPPTKII